MPISEVDNILQKFKKEEDTIELKLKTSRVRTWRILLPFEDLAEIKSIRMTLKAVLLRLRMPELSVTTLYVTQCSYGFGCRSNENQCMISEKCANNVLNIKSINEAKKRNHEILKDLETVKGNLRSKAIFSPSELQWKEICENYQCEPSLVINKWRCHLPIYV